MQSRNNICLSSQVYKSVFLFIKEVKFHYKWGTYIKMRWMDSPLVGDRYKDSIVQCVWSSAFSKITTVQVIASFGWSVAMTILLHFMTMHVLYQPCSRSLNDLQTTGHDFLKLYQRLLVILEYSWLFWTAPTSLLAKFIDISGPSKIHSRFVMMTSSNGNIFRFTGPRWIPSTKASDAGLWCFIWSAPE